MENELEKLRGYIESYGRQISEMQMVIDAQARRIKSFQKLTDKQSTINRLVCWIDACGFRLPPKIQKIVDYEMAIKDDID